MRKFTFIFLTLFLVSCTSNTENKTKTFSMYSQDERKEYIKEYLAEQYNLTCEVSDVKQKQTDVFNNEDYYFATVTTSDNKAISVWISKDGVFYDSVALLNAQDKITEYFKSLLGNYTIETYTELRHRPSKTNYITEDIEDFFSRENTYSYIKLYSDHNISDTEIKALTEKLNGVNATFYVYVNKNLLDSIEIEKRINEE